MPVREALGFATPKSHVLPFCMTRVLLFPAAHSVELADVIARRLKSERIDSVMWESTFSTDDEGFGRVSQTVDAVVVVVGTASERPFFSASDMIALGVLLARVGHDAVVLVTTKFAAEALPADLVSARVITHDLLRVDEDSDEVKRVVAVVADAVWRIASDRRRARSPIRVLGQLPELVGLYMLTIGFVLILLDQFDIYPARVVQPLAIASIVGGLLVVLLRRLQRTLQGTLRSTDEEMARLRTAVELEFAAQRRALTVATERLSAFSAPIRHGAPSDVGTPGIRNEPTLSRSADCGELLREMAHSLHTPLSQAEAAALTLDRAAARDQDANAAERIIASVDICRAFIDGFRRVAAVQVTSEKQWSLRATLHAAHEVYRRAAGKEVTVTVDAPDTIPGYSTEFLLAVMLPLVENAVESAVEATTVRVQVTANDSVVRASVSSRPVELPKDRMYDRGYTTKPGHLGLGLSTVTRLLGVYRGAKLAHDIRDDTVTFTVTLPAGR
jgi:nitrogen-specific signal transduction histidine kinase